MYKIVVNFTLRKRCPYSELVWSAFSRIQTEYPYSVEMRENADQNNSQYERFSRSASYKISSFQVSVNTLTVNKIYEFSKIYFICTGAYGLQIIDFQIYSN